MLQAVLGTQHWGLPLVPLSFSWVVELLAVCREMGLAFTVLGKPFCMVYPSAPTPVGILCQ